jgi:hypothetical protein
MTKDRAQEILQAINASRFGWQSDTKKLLHPGEWEQVRDVWDEEVLACWADALEFLASGRECSTCYMSSRPGYIRNAFQWLRCPKCNGVGKYAPRSIAYEFNSGHVQYQNIKGRCEDAPCGDTQKTVGGWNEKYSDMSMVQ